MLLNQSRQSIEISRTHVAAERAPFWSGTLCGFHCSIDIGRTARGEGRQLFSAGRVEGVEMLSCSGFAPFTSDEMSETPVMTLEPGHRLLRIFRRGAVLHADEFFGDAHCLCTL